LLEAWQRRSKLLEETISLLYIEGLSTRDFKRALKPVWGESGLSRSSISGANKALKEAFNNWHRGKEVYRQAEAGKRRVSEGSKVMRAVSLLRQWLERVEKHGNMGWPGREFAHNLWQAVRIK